MRKFFRTPVRTTLTIAVCLLVTAYGISTTLRIMAGASLDQDQMQNQYLVVSKLWIFGLVSSPLTPVDACSDDAIRNAYIRHRIPADVAHCCDTQMQANHTEADTGARDTCIRLQALAFMRAQQRAAAAIK